MRLKALKQRLQTHRSSFNLAQYRPRYNAETNGHPHPVDVDTTEVWNNIKTISKVF